MIPIPFDMQEGWPDAGRLLQTFFGAAVLV